jgi:hypothetical protein
LTWRIPPIHLIVGFADRQGLSPFDRPVGQTFARPAHEADGGQHEQKGDRQFMAIHGESLLSSVFHCILSHGSGVKQYGLACKSTRWTG